MPTKIKTFDPVLFIIPVIFIVASVAIIYSLVFETPDAYLASKQGLFVVIGVIAMVTVSLADYRFFRGTHWIFYTLSLILLILVEFFGKTAKGATNWIDLGFFQLQPSEVAKAALILSLANFFSSKVGSLTLKQIFVSLLLLFPPLFLILIEPDFGTALVIIFVYLVLLFASKLSRLHRFLIVGIIALGIALIILSAYNISPFNQILRPYQRNRILTFLNPAMDPYGRGYNVRQAQISVGSGGLLGKGLGHGSQSQLQFLPEPHTDFIFAGIAESFGFIGSVAFLALYLWFIVKMINVASVAQDNFGAMISLGIAAMFSFQVLVNVGMNIGVAPVTGIPLPLLSYGGSSMLVSLFLIGLVQSIFIRHKKISF